MSDSREEFEREIVKVFENIDLDWNDVQEDYNDYAAAVAWESWQAATSKQAERIAQLELALKQKNQKIKEITIYAALDTSTINGLAQLQTEAISIQPSQEALDCFRNSIIDKCAEIADNNEYEHNRFDAAGSGDEIRKLKLKE